MAHKRIANHLGIHRRRSGFTQRELARLVGYSNHVRVSRHERGVTTPSLATALSYEAVFRIPIYELFPGVHEVAVKNTEARMADLEAALGQKKANDRNANATARKLQFIQYDRPTRNQTN